MIHHFVGSFMLYNVCMKLFPQKFDLLKIPSKNYFEGRHKGVETSGEVSPGGFTFLRGWVNNLQSFTPVVGSEIFFGSSHGLNVILREVKEAQQLKKDGKLLTSKNSTDGWVGVRCAGDWWYRKTDRDLPEIRQKALEVCKIRII